MKPAGSEVHIGLDLGGTKVYGALVGSDGAIAEACYREHGPGGDPGAAAGGDSSAPPSQEERVLGPAYRCLLDVAGDLIARARAGGRIPVGVGVGAPGVTRPDGTVVLAGGLGWRDVTLGALLEGRLGLPVAVENDANLAALGENAFGAARGKGSLFLMTLGTGIGGAVVLGGRLWRGHRFAAGEIGALLPGREYLSWASPEIGAYETHAAGAGMLAEARRLAGEAGLPFRDEDGQGERLFAHAAAGVPWAVAVVDRAVDLWTIALGAVQSIFDPEMVVLSGGMASSAGRYLPAIAARLRQALPAVCEMAISTLGYRATVLGVPALFAERPAQG